MGTMPRNLSSFKLPSLPTNSVKDFVPYLTKNPDTSIAVLVSPYKDYESQLRKIYAQQPFHSAVKDGTVNLVPLFAGNENELKIRARSLEGETEDEKSKYIMPLKDEDRKKSGDMAIVGSLKDFQKNFSLFSETSLTDLDWSNVVAAGSAVTTSLLPVPEKWAGSKRSLREYYHQHLAPASDIDLFIYGLNEEQAIEKIKQIEKNIRDSVLHEITTIRTKNAITIAGQYPNRHVQIVLRLYDSISQIITGFDVDCACAAYTGDQVYASPRAIASFVTQCNTIDLSRRSPSYENRLSKYSHRGFEVYWPLLDRSRIDPTIFERSFGRTQGLARLLILEKLPKAADRDAYADQRRSERGRPQRHINWRDSCKRPGNFKDQEEDDVAEWVEEEEVSSYHSMTVPYGPKYQPRKINRLLYAKDLLLNAEWNQSDDRTVYLHRHPCFFGTAEEVIQDCCGYCPVPKTDEEIAVAAEEHKHFVSGKLKFLKDDPGRQEIGSFNPITDDEWTTMSYVGDTARLCQAIVDGDLEYVEDWCSNEGVDINRRDYTGRTPLHLATMASTPEIVNCLISHGARLIARLVDGRTALHIAAARGNIEMIQALMDKSLANEDAEDDRLEALRSTRRVALESVGQLDVHENEAEKSDDEGSEMALESEIICNDSEDSMTMGSFVKVGREEKDQIDIPEDSSEEPDVYDINILAWDYGFSPLHLAIINGHLEVIELLVSQYGADVLLPVKIVEPGTRNAEAAIMTLVLALSLSKEKSKDVVKLLLKLGATSAQADMGHFTAFHYIVGEDNADILDLLLDYDRPAALSIMNNTGKLNSWGYEIQSPLITAITGGYHNMAKKLLKLGANPCLSYDDWIKTFLAMNPHARNRDSEANMNQFRRDVSQPVIIAAGKEMGTTVQDLIIHGADPSTFGKHANMLVQYPQHSRYIIAESLLDVIQSRLGALRTYKDEPQTNLVKPETLWDEAFYTTDLHPDSYEFWNASCNYRAEKRTNGQRLDEYNKAIEQKSQSGLIEKKEAIAKLIQELEYTEAFLIKAGAKRFTDLHPEFPKREEHSRTNLPQLLRDRYKTKASFELPDLNDRKRTAYLKLFEAVWINDIETVKEMTLGPWGQEAELNPPLKIAVKDKNWFSPFSIAVLRGHRDLAKIIVEIAAAQYQKQDGRDYRQRWNIERSDSDDGENGENLPIFSELVSDKYTIDNLGEVSDVVKSEVPPLTMIEWMCKARRFGSERSDDTYISIAEYSVDTEDNPMFRFLLDLGIEQRAVLVQEDDSDLYNYQLDHSAFSAAIRLGRTGMLAEAISKTGVGIPLGELVSKCGLEIRSKPRSYQGLTVGGKKRADWAQRPGVAAPEEEGERVPPLLEAAHLGSIESVEWFMSDAPIRRYMEFAANNGNDARIKLLEAAGQGFEKAIGAWLNKKRELVLHSAILYDPQKKEDIPNYLALIKYIVSDVEQLQSMIHLFDKEAIKEMLLERCADSPGALTPLALWMAKNAGQQLNMKFGIVKELCKYSTGEELQMINGEGDLPLHVAVKCGASTMTAFLLSLNPSLLYRENTTGRTALEMSCDLYTAFCIESAPSTRTQRGSRYNNSGNYSKGLADKPAADFAAKENEEEIDRKRTFEVCKDIDERLEKKGEGRKRRLVSLFEANEVAQRLAGDKKGAGGRRSVINGGVIDEEGKPDFISRWMQMATVAEEHYVSSAALSSSSEVRESFARFPPHILDRLKSLGKDRIENLDKNGIDVQVISHGPCDTTPEICQAANDELASAISAHPTRLAGFAMLPMAYPAAAAEELERCIKTHGFLGALIDNHLNGEFYDNEKYWCIFEKAQKLDTVLYIHPTFTAEKDMAKYRGNYSELVAASMSNWGWGWHSDTGLHIIKLWAAGLFERYPQLKIVIGHMGEMIPAMLTRIEGGVGRFTGRTGKESFKEVWKRNLWVTCSGVFDVDVLELLVKGIGKERVMYSVDFPFSGNEKGRAFLEEVKNRGMFDDEAMEGFAAYHICFPLPAIPSESHSRYLKMSTSTRRARGKRPAEQNDESSMPPAAKKQQSSSTRGRGSDARGRGGSGGKGGAKLHPAADVVDDSDSQNNSKLNRDFSSSQALKSVQQIIDLDEPDPNTEVGVKSFHPRGYNALHLEEENVYIEIDKDDPKYCYAIPANVLFKASPWFAKTIRDSVPEEDQDKAERYQKESGFYVRYELKKSRSDDGTSKWVLERAPFTYLRPKTSASLIHTPPRQSPYHNLVRSPHVNPPRISPMPSSNTVSISKDKGREVQKRRKFDIDLTAPGKEELAALETNDVTPAKSSRHGPANYQNPHNPRNQIALNTTLTLQPVVAPLSKEEMTNSDKPQIRPRDEEGQTSIMTILSQIKDAPPRVDYQLGLDGGCDNEGISGPILDNRQYIPQNSEVNDSQYLAPATPILQGLNHVIFQTGENFDNELMNFGTEIAGQSAFGGTKNESIEKQGHGEQNQSAQNATAPVSTEAHSSDESPTTQEKTPNSEILSDQGNFIMPKGFSQITQSTYAVRHIGNHVGKLDVKEEDDATGLDSFNNTVSEKERNASNAQQDILSGYSNKKVECNNERYNDLEPALDDMKNKSEELFLEAKVDKAQKCGFGQKNEDCTLDSPQSGVPGAPELRNTSPAMYKAVEQRIGFLNTELDESPRLSLRKRNNPHSPSSSPPLAGDKMDTVMQNAPLQTPIETAFKRNVPEKPSHSSASTGSIIREVAASTLKPLTVRPPRELCEAYNNFFSIIYEQSSNLDAENIDTAFSQVQMVQELAHEFRCPNITRRKLMDHLARFDQVLWQAVKADPPRWLLLSISLQFDRIFREAIVHMVGRLQPYTKNLWPWNSTPPNCIPNHIHDLLEQKAQYLERRKSEVNYELFTSSISIHNKVLTYFNRSPETQATYDIVRLWRDWFSSSLAELRCQCLNLEDRQYKDGVVYRKMAAGDNAYLPIAKVFEEVMMEKDGGKFVPETFKMVAEDLGLMKAYAQKTVRPLCESLIMLDEESEGIEYLTCTRVTQYDLPWGVSRED
ncbi:hypothetical protein B7494_g3670 [Chlorociboria aeruginascens]|nr:hypothetical protein B7494_g3670 [Chlorociboria aeruginascens]